MNVQDKIVETLTGTARPLTVEQIQAATQAKYAVLLNNLSGMVRNGVLYRPSRGLYAIAKAGDADIERLTRAIAPALRRAYPGAETEIRLLALCRADVAGRTTRMDVRAALNEMSKRGQATFIYADEAQNVLWSAPIPGFNCRGIEVMPAYPTASVQPPLADLLA